MRIIEVQPAPHAEYELAGAILTIGGIAINLEAEQGDSQAVIDICQDSSGDLARGVCGAYVASVLIPPATYHDEEGGEDMNGNPCMIKVKDPVNTDAVELMLWQYQTLEDNTEEE